MRKTLCKSDSVDTTTTRMTQVDRFKEAARQLEVDKSEAAFDEKLRGIVGHKPPAERDPKKKA